MINMNFIFFKDRMDQKWREVYNIYSSNGKIIYGCSQRRNKTVFINLSVINRFTTLCKTITHETLHIVAKLNGSEANEKIIEKMVNWCFE
jgi:hypothetical protein